MRYALSELTRRRGRTIVTISGLALGVALVIVIASLTRGLDDAQAQALDPLASIGTDLTVTLAPEESIGNMIGVIDKLTLADTGKFLFYDGKEAPW